MIQLAGSLWVMGDSNTAHSQAIRCFLGERKLTAQGAIAGDTGWESCLVMQRCGTGLFSFLRRNWPTDI